MRIEQGARIIVENWIHAQPEDVIHFITDETKLREADAFVYVTNHPGNGCSVTILHRNSRIPVNGYVFRFAGHAQTDQHPQSLFHIGAVSYIGFVCKIDLIIITPVIIPYRKLSSLFPSRHLIGPVLSVPEESRY